MRPLGLALALAVLVGPGLIPARAAGDCRVRVLISAVHSDPALTGEPDEAVELCNPGPGPVGLEGWRLTDGQGQATFPPVVLAPGSKVWVARQATAFR